MHSFFDSKFQKKIISIGPGEYFVTKDDMVIQTVLGSCIAVCLFSDFDAYCGMNHFMLPGEASKNNDYDSARYGMYSMEMLINSLLKSGVNRKHLKAKVFGGGNVINFKTIKASIGENNIQFILNFLEKENIPIISNHLGGEHARKILFFSDSKKVLLKQISKTEEVETLREEIEYNKSLVQETKKTSNIILFDD
ncbi:MAG: hypothetical protein A2086_05325 [Spirochaetes bacterium GWD1_27_9]|nr:MAG: hypothetical protein A2Z98_05250 [Spirochaetes bacterium GWB1_27_13]OHD45598.1 MAG: hypothetical protein A2086_05325 [Spirochaetes bacterium GWD1_27_9]